MENWKAPKYEIKRNRLAWNVSVNNKRAAAKLERAYRAAGFDTRVEAIGYERLDDRHFVDRGRQMVFVYTTAMEWDEFAAKCQGICDNLK
jgi:hypothetical protein